MEQIAYPVFKNQNLKHQFAYLLNPTDGEANSQHL